MKCLFKSFVSFFKILSFLLLSFESSYIYSGYNSFVRDRVCKYFLLVCGLSFHSLNSIIQKIEVLNFGDVQIYHFFFYDYAFGVIS